MNQYYSSNRRLCQAKSNSVWPNHQFSKNQHIFFRIFGQIQLSHQLLPLANLDGCECRSAPNVPRHERWENVSKIFHIDGWVCGYLCRFNGLTWKVVVGIILKYSQVRILLRRFPTNMLLEGSKVQTTKSEKRLFERLGDCYPKVSGEICFRGLTTKKTFSSGMSNGTQFWGDQTWC